MAVAGMQTRLVMPPSQPNKHKAV